MVKWKSEEMLVREEGLRRGEERGLPRSTRIGKSDPGPRGQLPTINSFPRQRLHKRQSMLLHCGLLIFSLLNGFTSRCAFPILDTRVKSD